MPGRTDSMIGVFAMLEIIVDGKSRRPLIEMGAAACPVPGDVIYVTHHDLVIGETILMPPDGAVDEVTVQYRNFTVVDVAPGVRSIHARLYCRKLRTFTTHPLPVD